MCPKNLVKIKMVVKNFIGIFNINLLTGDNY